MGNRKGQWKKALGLPGATAAKALAFLFVVCLVECASGSCLSYGHSCWGAHGKRSGYGPPEQPKVPDWYLMRLLRRLANTDDKNLRQAPNDVQDINTIFRLESPENFPTAYSRVNTVNSENAPAFESIKIRRHPEAIPMLDDNALDNEKLMQLMRDASDEK